MDHLSALDGWSSVFDDESHLPAHQDMVVASASGSRITDSRGRAFIDAASGHSCVNLGYANDELIEAACEAYRTLAYCSPEHRCRPVAALAEQLSAKLGGGYRLRFSATGGGANELAIEIARRHFLHRGRPMKRGVIAFDRAYHGSTGLASFASGPGVLQSPQADRDAAFHHVAAARDPLSGRSRDLPALLAGLEAEIAARGADRIAAFIVEPIAFAGGVIVPPDGFLSAAAALCRANDILLIADEIITGFGRSGRWFGFQWTEALRPDIVTMGKGITSAYFPLSAVAVSDAVFESFLVPGNQMTKLVTMAGHPVGCAIALKVIEIMERDDLVGRVARNAATQLSHLVALADLPHVRDVRGRGHLWGIELGDSEGRSGESRALSVAAECLAAGVLVLQAGPMIRINPPLTIDDAELATVRGALEAAVARAI